MIDDGPDRLRSRTPPRRGRREPDALNPGNNLYVTGLSTRVNEKDLQEHFSREGKVLECRLVLDPRTRESRGFGFVTMDHLDDAERCIKHLNRSTLEGRMITVEKGSLQKQPIMSTFEEDEMGVTEGVESEEMEGMGLRDEKKREERLSVGCRAYGCKHYRRWNSRF